MKSIRLIYYDEIDSTNEELKRNINNFEEFTVILADFQSKGKGRNNREWFSPKGENLYFSFILESKIEIKYLSGLPIIIGFSILKILEEFIKNKKIYIKWPNDIIVESKKICGILVEYYKNKIIAGIGLNVNSENFPNFQENNPTSVKLETGKDFDRLIILKIFLKKFQKFYLEFQKVKKIPDNILLEINDKLFLKNEDVLIEFHNSFETGKIQGINEVGALILDNKLIYAGDVKKIRRRGK